MENKQFKPFVPAERVMPEFTAFSIVLGIILAVVFGGANAYLGLRIGTTISASIPAAVLSMGVMRIIFKRDSILENNTVQTIGSAGESLAAGAIFTMPALFMWADEGVCDVPSIVDIALIALCGGAVAFAASKAVEEYDPTVGCFTPDHIVYCKANYLTVDFNVTKDELTKQVAEANALGSAKDDGGAKKK